MARVRANGNGKRLATPQSVDAAVKAICDIMRRSNCAGALQYVPELTWILFLRILDEREAREADRARAVAADFTRSLEPPYRWRDWAAPGGPKRQELQDGTLGSVLSFVNTELLPYLRGLHERLRDNRYVAPPVERVWIEKDEGKKRPISQPCFEDKIVQRAVVMILEAIFAPDFHAFSHGFRKGHSPHQALHELREQCRTLHINWIVDADVSGFFDYAS